jgi:hypothetical protein
MSKLNRNRGKRAERAVVQRLGGKRMGVLGGEDVQHPFYSIEVKSREKHAIFKVLKQCEDNNKDNKIPLIVIHEHNKPHDRDLVCLKMEEFEVMYEFLKHEGYYREGI